MIDIKSQSQYENYSDRQLAELIANGDLNDQEAQSLRQLIIRRRVEYYRGLIDPQNPPPPEPPKPKDPNQPKPNPPAPPKPDPESGSAVSQAIWFIIAIFFSFWSVPKFGWLIGLLFAAAWPIVTAFGILALIFGD